MEVNIFGAHINLELRSNSESFLQSPKSLFPHGPLRKVVFV